MFDKQTIKDISLDGQRVLVRVDYNVPLKDGIVADDYRIAQSLPTLRYLIERGCSVVLMSHLGRPEGRVDPAFSLKPVAERLSQLIEDRVPLLPDCVGPEVAQAVSQLKPGQVVLLENVRFNPGDEANDEAFARQLANHGEIFVQECFGVAHRTHASIVGVAKFLPAVAGFLLEREVTTIRTAVEHPKRPQVIVMGGAKISDKLDLLNRFIDGADILAIGGAMANTFLAARGGQIGKSLYEPDQLELARHIMGKAAEAGKQFLLPTDVVVTDRLAADASGRTVKVSEIGPEDIIADIGEETARQYGDAVSQAASVVWNGPLGVAEHPQFAKGSLAVAKAIGAANAFSLIGGGDTAAFIDGAGLHGEFDFISTGGGASLELMAGHELPGVEALLDK